MAKFGEKVFDFKDVLKSYRIPIAIAGEQWFLNVGRNSVVNVHDQKTLHTWTLTHPHYFTSSIVHSDGDLYCVMDKNVLVKWSVEEDNLKNAAKFKFEEPIFDLIPVNETKPIIIFESGKYAVITNTFNDIKPSGELFLKENEDLNWADACISPTDIKVFCLAYNQKEQYRVVYHFSINKESFSASSFLSQKLYQGKGVLKSWCLNHHECLFLSLWSDGKLFSHNFKESKDTHLLNFKDVEKNCIIAIECIDSTHIVIGKALPKKEECILEIWDLKCSIMKAKKILKMPCLNYMQIAAINSNIFLCYNKELVSITFHIDDPTFYSALGMSESSKYVQHSWNTELELIELPTNDEPETMDICSNQDSLDSVEIILDKLINKNSPDLMCIPESELIKLLQLATRHSKEGSNFDSGHESFDKNMYILLNIVFSASFNDFILLKHLKRMDLEESLVVLEWLLSFLNHTVRVPPDIVERPSDLQIVNWICLFIQSHTESLLFTKDKTSMKILKQLEKALSAKMEEYDDFECIQSYFSIIEKKEILPEKCSLGNYCVEKLEI